MTKLEKHSGREVKCGLCRERTLAGDHLNPGQRDVICYVSPFRCLTAGRRGRAVGDEGGRGEAAGGARGEGEKKEIGTAERSSRRP